MKRKSINSKKKKNKLMPMAASAAAVAMVVSPLANTGFGEEIFSTKEALASGFAGGSGTVEEPYLISTTTQFGLIESYPSAHFKLINDIDFNNGSTFITSFHGILDGNGYAVRNLSLTSGKALFGLVDTMAKIHNIKFDTINMDAVQHESYGSSSIGGAKVTAHVSGSGLIHVLFGTLENIKANNIHSTNVGGNGSYGILVGVMNTGNAKLKNISITNSSIDYVRVGSGTNRYGGLVGQISVPTGYTTSVENIYMDIAIKFTLSGTSRPNRMGLMVAEVTNTTIKNVYATGSMEGRASSFGGIIGTVGASTVVTNVVSNLNTFKQNHSTTSTSSSNGTGGIAGLSRQTTSTIKGAVVLGNKIANGSTSLMTNKTSKAVGDNNTSLQSYALATALGNNLSGETIITEAQSKSKSFYESIGFDFTTDWGIHDGHSYPFLLYSLSDTERESYLQQQNQGKYDEATTAVEKAESTKSTTNITMARNLVNALPNGTVKTNLTNRLNTLEKDMKYQTVLVAVEKAEETFNAGNLAQAQTDKNAAQTLVNSLGSDETRKQGLQVRLDALQTQIDDAKAEQQKQAEKEAKYNQALQAVIKAESSFNDGNYDQAQLDKNTAQTLVNGLGADESRKQGLQDRLEALQRQIDDAKAAEQAQTEKDAKYEEALVAVEKAEGTFNGGNYDQAQLDKNTAQGLVEALGTDEPRKQNLQDRLDALQTQIDDAKAEQQAQADKELKYNEALAAVAKAEGSFNGGNYDQAQLDKNAAQTLVDSLGSDEPRKQNLQDRLDALQTQIDDAKAAEQEQADQEAKYNEALTAVGKAESSFNADNYVQAQLDKNAAQTLVNALGADESRKSVLQDRLDALQNQIDDVLAEQEAQAEKDTKYNAALAAVVKAEGSFNAGNYDQAQLEQNVAQTLVNAFGSDEPRKQNLQDRLDALQTQIDDAKAAEQGKNLTNPVQNLAIVADGPKQVTVSFDAIPHATEYIIKRNGVVVAYVDEPTYVDTNVNHNKTYTYEVSARNASSTSPTTIANITTPIQYRDVTLAWPASPEPTDYQVYRNNQLIGETTENTYTDDQAVEGENYTYRVDAMNEATGEMLSTNEFTLIPSKDESVFLELAEPDAVPKVQNIQATQQAEQVNVTWDAFDKANRYRVQIYVYDELTGEYVREGFGRVTTSNFISFDTLKEGRTYKFEVVPQTNKYLNESANESAPITLEVTPPPVVVPPAETYNFKVTVNGTTADLTWDEMTDATRYRVQLYVKDASGLFIKKGPSSAIGETAFSYKNLIENETYKFVVEPRIGYTYKLDEALEATVTIGTIEPEETPVDDSNEFIRNIQVEMQGKQAELSWDGAQIEGTDITTYRVVRYVKDDLTGQYKHDGLARSVTRTSYTDTYKLLPGKTYQYEIIPRIGYKYDEVYKATISDVVNEVK